jgi:lipopolysaccharide/colanic/teichoic acid biosynthesis glycosyltransferase
MGRRLSPTVQPETLAQRYAQLAQEAAGRPGIDVALRALDLTLAATLLVLLAPVICLVAVAILVTSGTPVLYRGERVGRGGHLFTMLKFRTLRPDAESRLRDSYGKELTERTRGEVTRFGRWLRVAQLDELPQLWNVLRGDMSVVGPRPVRPAFFEELVREIPEYWQRLVIRPGLTGFAQTRMGREESWGEKLAHDLEWIADRSLGLYLRTVVSTGWRVARQSLRGRARARL